MNINTFKWMSAIIIATIVAFITSALVDGILRLLIINIPNTDYLNNESEMYALAVRSTCAGILFFIVSTSIAPINNSKIPAIIFIAATLLHYYYNDAWFAESLFYLLGAITGYFLLKKY